MGELVIATRIRAPIAVCFDAALDVAMHTESAKFSNERLVAPGKLTGRLELGDLICFEGRHFGFRQTFCARITELNRPHRFVDEMVRGAFKWLRHEHEFTEQDGVTIMVDKLRWEVPLGILGRIVDRLVIRPHMGWFVKTKQAALAGLLDRSRV